MKIYKNFYYVKEQANNKKMWKRISNTLAQTCKGLL